jgi:hypothetical protein
MCDQSFLPSQLDAAASSSLLQRYESRDETWSIRWIRLQSLRAHLRRLLRQQDNSRGRIYGNRAAQECAGKQWLLRAAVCTRRRLGRCSTLVGCLRAGLLFCRGAECMEVAVLSVRVKRGGEIRGRHASCFWETATRAKAQAPFADWP